MAISPVLDIARRALLAQESALGVVGHNIANVNTPGYTRQRPDLVAERGEPSSGGVLIGTGVRLRAVVQVIDPLLARRRLHAETGAGGETTRRDQLGALAEALNDLAQPSLAGAVDGFFDAADALARNPGGLAERQTLLGRASAVAVALNQRGAAVANLQRAADDRLVAGVRDVNGLLDRIAALNREIGTTEVSGQQANDLRDSRQALLNDLAGKLAITAVTDERGTVTVSSAAGPVLVADGDVVHTLATRTRSGGLDGAVLHDLGLADAVGGFLDVPAVFTSGTLGGLAGVRDGELVTASEHLDLVAGALRDAVNAIQTDAAARDLGGNGTAATPLFAGLGAKDLVVAITDPRLLAAARSTQPGDNQNALRLADLRTAAPLTAAPASAAALALGNSPLSQYLATELGRVGEDAGAASDRAAASTLFTKQLEAQRASLSGVNLNEELTDLLKYQRAFQAVAQVLNVANTMLDELVRVV